MDKECYTPGPPAKANVGVGKETQLNGLDVYFSKPEGTAKAVILFSDPLGWKVSLLRKFADEIAAAGFAVAVPDFFRGDALVDRAAAQEWLSKHPFGPVTEDTVALAKYLKEKGFKSIGVAGFCWGGKVAVLAGASGEVDATVLLHPSLLTIDDLKEFKGALAILSGEVDKVTSPASVKEFEEYLKANRVEVFAKIFPGVGHSWTVKYDENDPAAVKSAEEAHQDTINWFTKHLK